MKQFTCTCFVLLGLASLCLSSPIVKRQVNLDDQHLNPAEQDLSDLDEDANRDKRKIEGAVELKYGAKNAILGLIFNPIANVRLSYVTGTGAALPVARAGVAGPTTTEDAVNFTPGEKVSLELPDPLFGSGFSLVTNISKAAGNLIQNSAERTAKLFELMKPFFQKVFGVESLKITRDIPIDNKI